MDLVCSQLRRTLRAPIRRDLGRKAGFPRICPTRRSRTFWAWPSMATARFLERNSGPIMMSRFRSGANWRNRCGSRSVRVARDPGGASRVSVHNATRRAPTSKMAAYGWVFWRSRSSAPNPASRGANRRRCPARYALEPLALNRFESLVCRFSGGMRFQYGQRFASRQPHRRLVLSCRLGECLLHGGIVMFQFSQYFGGNTAD